MADPQVRSMTREEFADYRRRAIAEYAAEHVRVGDWSPEDAERLAAEETDGLLPDGVDTAGNALLVAEAEGDVVGIAWVGPAPGRSGGWWIYDIEVVPDQRGRGYGRALLAAAEREVQDRGGDALGLNVFGGNDAARRMYESAGYEVSSMQMRKRLAP